MATESTSGHRLLPHTADVIVEAWGPDEPSCAGAAARGLIETCVSGEPDPEAAPWLAEIGMPHTDLVRTVLDEVVFALDTSERVPVSVRLDGSVDSGLVLRLGLADRDTVRFTGAAPKAIVILTSGVGTDGLSRCRFIVDV